MYNRQITHAPVALFLGAGASKPFGKMLMADFITSLYADTTFSSSTLFNQIVQENRDLEYLFEQLEDWAEKKYVEHNTGTGTPSLYGAKELVSHAQKLLVELRKKVFDAYKDSRGRGQFQAASHLQPTAGWNFPDARRAALSACGIHNKL